MSIEYSIVIPAYAGRRLLEPCLRAALLQTVQAREIIVVDDASAEPVEEWVRAEFPSAPALRVIRNDRNLGFAGSANRGVATGRTPFVALLNDDTEVEPHWAERALANFSDRRVGSVATQIVYASDAYRLDSAGDLYLVGGLALRKGHGRPVWEGGPRRETFSACAAAAFYRRAALEELGAFLDPPGLPGLGVFDEAFGAYYEDVDLGFRLRLAGWTCVYEPEARCRHQVSSSYGANLSGLHFQSSRNAEMVFWSDMPDALLRKYFLAHLVFCAAQAAKKLFVDRQALAWLAGKLAFCASIPRVLERRRFIQSRAKAIPAQIRAAMQSAP